MSRDGRTATATLVVPAGDPPAGTGAAVAHADDPAAAWEGMDRPAPPAAVLARAAVESMAALVLVVDAAGYPVLANPALLRATGWTEAELFARPFWEVLAAPEDLDNARDHVRRAIRDGAVFPQEGDWLDRSGGRRRVAMQNSVVRDGRGAPVAVVTVGVDVTDQRRAEADLRERAATDPLTGLRNRAALFEALAAALTGPGATGCALLFADLDGFKAANDGFGHHVGDLVLVEVAARLRRLTGVHDVVARLGGDEFVVLCPGPDGGRLTALADRVQGELSRPVTTPHGSVPIGVSIGTASARPGADPDAVVRTADRRMYRVKQAHRAAGTAAAL